VILELSLCRIERIAQNDFEVFVRTIGSGVAGDGNFPRRRRYVDAYGEQVALRVASVREVNRHVTPGYVVVKALETYCALLDHVFNGRGRSHTSEGYLQGELHGLRRLQTACQRSRRRCFPTRERPRIASNFARASDAPHDAVSAPAYGRCAACPPETAAPRRWPHAGYCFTPRSARYPLREKDVPGDRAGTMAATIATP
jgi:hypothetical protein